MWSGTRDAREPASQGVSGSRPLDLIIPILAEVPAAPPAVLFGSEFVNPKDSRMVVSPSQSHPIDLPQESCGPSPGRDLSSSVRFWSGRVVSYG